MSRSERRRSTEERCRRRRRRGLAAAVVPEGGHLRAVTELDEAIEGSGRAANGTSGLRCQVEDTEEAPAPCRRRRPSPRRWICRSSRWSPRRSARRRRPPTRRRGATSPCRSDRGAALPIGWRSNFIERGSIVMQVILVGARPGPRLVVEHRRIHPLRVEVGDGASIGEERRGRAGKVLDERERARARVDVDRC